MRWDRLFDDLEGQLEQELSAEELDERAEEERLRLGRLSLRDRIVAVHDAVEADEAADDADHAIAVVLASGEMVTVRPTTFGRDWFAAVVVEAGAPRVHCIVPIEAIAALVLSRTQTEQSLTPAAGERGEHSLSARLTLTFVLRDLCRRRAPVRLHTRTGELNGTIDRVGRDHLDLAVHEIDQPRRSRAVVQYRVVPFAQLLLVRF
ncbi:MAG: hypothetical protein JWM51_519 [Microbacteriaceae bacterium]|jgi:hypothetical protein|nr:hypothetical protein [Microbacteriaceae bacterium]